MLGFAVFSVTAPAQAPRADPDSLPAITADLAASQMVYLEVARGNWDPGEDVAARAVIGNADLGSGKLKGNWDRMAAALAQRPELGRGYAALIAVHGESAKQPLWKAEYALDANALAKASRMLVPGKTARSHMDVPAIIAVRIPAGRLEAGKTYRVTLSFRAPDGSEHRFEHGSTPETGMSFAVRPTPLDLAKLSLPTRVTDAGEVLTGAVEIGNPGKRRFPKDDAGDCQARSVWSLQSFQDRVYVGHGDWSQNRGPIDLWSFGLAGDDPLAARYGRYAFTAGKDPRFLFIHEYTVQEHSIDRFRVSGDRLMVPGVDGLREGGPDGVLFGNIYVREKGHWRKLSTLDHTYHVFDVVGVGARLYATADRFKTFGPSVVESEDGGLSWQVAFPGEGELVSHEDGLVVLRGTHVDLLKDGKRTEYRGEFTPGCEPDAVHRAMSFAGGVVYTTWDSWGRSKLPSHPLYYLRDFKEGPRLVGPFQGKNVRDLYSEGGILYVLTGRAERDGRFAGEIYSSRDLRNWTRLAAFSVPAMPNALASLGSKFFVGLANRGYDSSHYDDLKDSRYEFADTASGSIWRISK